MTTLYDVLGIDKSASQEQIENAYRRKLESLEKNSPDGMTEEHLNKAKASKEAYAILSVPAKRDAYDARIAAKLQPVKASAAHVADEPGFPWLKLIVGLVLIVGAVVYYRVDAKKEETARIAMEAAKAKAEAERAKLEAEAEEARIAAEQIQARRKAEEENRRFAERAQYESARLGRQSEYAESQAAWQRQNEERKREQAERQAKYEKEREEHAARERVRQQNAAMERALARPIR